MPKLQLQFNHFPSAVPLRKRVLRFNEQEYLWPEDPLPPHLQNTVYIVPSNIEGLSCHSTQQKDLLRLNYLRIDGQNYIITNSTQQKSVNLQAIAARSNLYNVIARLLKMDFFSQHILALATNTYLNRATRTEPHEYVLGSKLPGIEFKTSRFGNKVHISIENKIDQLHYAGINTVTDYDNGVFKVKLSFDIVLHSTAEITRIPTNFKNVYNIFGSTLSADKAFGNVIKIINVKSKLIKISHHPLAMRYWQHIKHLQAHAWYQRHTAEIDHRVEILDGDSTPEISHRPGSSTSNSPSRPLSRAPSFSSTGGYHILQEASSSESLHVINEGET